MNRKMQVGSIVTENPSRSRVFERLGIDYCCQGKVSLEEACIKKGLDVVAVMVELAQIGVMPHGGRDWSEASLTELCDHIQFTHHQYLKNELPRLNVMADKVADRHGASDSRLSQLAGVLGEFVQELSSHMQKEEMVLFPLIRAFDRGIGNSESHCGSIQNPIRMMEMEHDGAGSRLGAMRKLSDDFVAPDWACPTYRALLDGLHQLEGDMHSHVHKENSILFPRAIERERQLAADLC